MALKPGWPILGWARTAVAPVGGALAACPPHALGTPLVHHLLAQAGLPAEVVDAVVLGNALGAGGNPARMLALAAGLPERTAALSVDTQCCAGMDAVTQACALLALGQAQVVLAGGAEAWSRAPLRMHRPQHAGPAPQPYEQPAFAPWPQRDPDMLDAAADLAAAQALTRQAQDTYAQHSHAQACEHPERLRAEIVPVAGLAHDAYPRPLLPERIARMPALRQRRGPQGQDCSLSPVAIAPKADGAALLLLAHPEACRRWGLRPRAAWLDACSLGGAPEVPMLCAQQAAQALLRRHHLRPQDLAALELHDAFAAQGLAFAQALGLPWQALHPEGSGLARGHPIAASGAIALVRALTRLTAGHPPAQARALACVAGAGGLGSATLLGPWNHHPS
jgi:acetyl-CoA C-acetyltransferase